MIERINTAAIHQFEIAKPVKVAENAEKEQSAEQTARKRDRFEHNAKSYRAGSPDDPQARKAFDEKRKAARANNA